MNSANKLSELAVDSFCSRLPIVTWHSKHFNFNQPRDPEVEKEVKLCLLGLLIHKILALINLHVFSNG